MTPDSASRDPVLLTQRESEVWFLVLRGKTSKLLALALGLSFRTVESHLKRLN